MCGPTTGIPKVYAQVDGLDPWPDVEGGGSEHSGVGTHLQVRSINCVPGTGDLSLIYAAAQMSVSAWLTRR